jgi:hypothetical protein
MLVVGVALTQLLRGLASLSPFEHLVSAPSIDVTVSPPHHGERLSGLDGAVFLV